MRNDAPGLVMKALELNTELTVAQLVQSTGLHKSAVMNGINQLKRERAIATEGTGSDRRYRRSLYV